MVKSENVIFCSVNKFVVKFITENKPTLVTANVYNELLENWKKDSTKLKHILKKGSEKPPTRPQSEYIYFCQHMRPLIQEELNKDQATPCHIHEITRKLGERWKAFKENPDPEFYNKLVELSAADKQRYHNEKQKNIEPAKNNVKSAYIYFCSLERKVKPKISLAELSQKWTLFKASDEYQNFLAEYEKIKME